MPRRTAAVVVYVLTAGAAILGGQHAAPETPVSAAGSHASASPDHAAAAPVTAKHEAAPPAAPAEARPATPPPGPVSAESQKAARPTAAKPANIQTIVERIQQRIDAEVVKPAAARATTARRARGAAAPARRAAVDRRIRLSWRVSLVWPPELESD
jgi:hypothetical protein